MLDQNVKFDEVKIEAPDKQYEDLVQRVRDLENAVSYLETQVRRLKTLQPAYAPLPG